MGSPAESRPSRRLTGKLDLDAVFWPETNLERGRFPPLVNSEFTDGSEAVGLLSEASLSLLGGVSLLSTETTDLLSLRTLVSKPKQH